MGSFGQRFLSAIKTDGVGIFAKIGIITLIGGYLFEIAPLTMAIIAIIGSAFLLTQKALRFFSNRYLLEMFYYLGIMYGIVITTWLGYIKAEGSTVYFVSALLGYLLYKTFNTYQNYSAYKNIEKDLLNYVVEQLETTEVVSIHAARKKSLFSSDEIKETISSFQQVNKLPNSLKIVE